MKSIAVTAKTSYTTSIHQCMIMVLGDTICSKCGLVLESRSIEEEAPKRRLYNDDDDDDDDENIGIFVWTVT